MLDLRQLNDFLEYTKGQEGPRISLHLNTHKAHPENRADPINYKNAVQDLKLRLQDSPHPRRHWEGAIRKMEELLEDPGFWEHTREGLVVLAAGERAAVFSLEYSVVSMHRFGSRFHLLPLFHLDDVLGYVYLLDLSRDRFTMHLVNPLGMNQVDTPEIKQSFPELFDDFDANANLRVGGFAGKDGMHYGHRARPEELQKDRDKYFRYLSDSFSRLHKDTGMHFILAGTADTLSHYQKIANGESYLDGVIAKPLDAMDEKAVLKEVTAIMRPLEEKELARLATEINNAKAANKAAFDLGDIRKAVKEGRVGRLIISYGLPEEQLDKIAAIVEEALAQGAEIQVINPKDRPLNQDYSAIMRF